jgi:hypothetical protein
VPELPPVDVLVRTSGELRVSNFMLWQIAGARVYFTGTGVAGVRRVRPGLGARPGALMPAVHDVTSLLAAVTAALPAAEDRPGQRAMAEAIDSGLRKRRHVIVQAGTGTGKTMGYLVPAIVAAARADTKVVVATATKALQDQLATKDLPFLTEHMPVPFTWSVLKGRSNYLCLQRLRELQTTWARASSSSTTFLVPCARTSTGSRCGQRRPRAETSARSPGSASDQAQRAVTVSGRRVPGSARARWANHASPNGRAARRRPRTRVVNSQPVRPRRGERGGRSSPSTTSS